MAADKRAPRQSGSGYPGCTWEKPALDFTIKGIGLGFEIGYLLVAHDLETLWLVRLANQHLQPADACLVQSCSGENRMSR